jgi:hypothetical protein
MAESGPYVESRGSGAGSGRWDPVINTLAGEAKSSNQLGRVVAPHDTQASETAPNHFALQPVARLSIRVDES